MQLEDINDSFYSYNPGHNIISLETNDISFSSPISYEENSIKNIQEKGLMKEKDCLTDKNESLFFIKENTNNLEFNNLNIQEDEIINNKTTNKLKHYGNTIPLLFNKEGEALIVIGPHCN